MTQVIITQYKWAGRWGPFKVKQHCGECDMTTGFLRAMMQREFKGKKVKFEIKPWLNNWWRVIWQGAWHAPIVFVNGKLFWQYHKTEVMFNKDKLKQLVFKKLKQ